MTSGGDSPKSGPLLPALPRMRWALWLNDQNPAAKLHLKFSVLRQAASDALITTGNSCERKALRQFVKKGEIIVGDRYYGLEYGFFGELRKLGVRFPHPQPAAPENRGGASPDGSG